MKESYESGSATYIGPESCGAAREGGVEAPWTNWIEMMTSVNEVLEISLSDSSEEFDVLRYQRPAENA